MQEAKNKIFNFLQEIGLHFHLEPIEGATFLPGLKLRNGELVIDEQKLLYPGDILHEAGHLACMPSETRKQMNDDLPRDDINTAGELMAIAWSFAACLYIDIDPHIVFHPDGYKGDSANIVSNFSAGRYFGVPWLEYYGMSVDPRTPSQQANPGQKYFPEMICWVCPQ